MEHTRGQQEAQEKLKAVAAQIRELVEPELRACLTTLNNLESEVGFLHAYQVSSPSSRSLSRPRTGAGDIHR
eukprot:747314-Hanusia_phi.AAC.13